MRRLSSIILVVSHVVTWVLKSRVSVLAYSLCNNGQTVAMSLALMMALKIQNTSQGVWVTS